jgi:hypothetical protein
MVYSLDSLCWPKLYFELLWTAVGSSWIRVWCIFILTLAGGFLTSLVYISCLVLILVSVEKDMLYRRAQKQQDFGSRKGIEFWLRNIIWDTKGSRITDRKRDILNKYNKIQHRNEKTIRSASPSSLHPLVPVHKRKNSTDILTQYSRHLQHNVGTRTSHQWPAEHVSFPYSVELPSVLTQCLTRLTRQPCWQST